MHHLRLNKKFLATALVCFMPVSLTHANGFRVPEVSVAGTAAANALVANTEELGAIPYNPAAISFHEGKNVMLGFNSVSYDHAVTPDGGTRTEGTGENSFLIPNFMASALGDNGVGFALLINSPFGLETQYPDETFPVFAGVLDRLEPETSRIKMVNINPNISYKIDENSSVAFGLDFYDVIDLTFNTQNIKINGSGNGMGFNIGYLHKYESFNLGVSYRSEVKTDLTGQFDARGIGSSVVGAQAALTFPSMLQIGVRFQPIESLGIEFDVEHTGWSSFNTININSSTGPLTSSTNRWKNTLTYRLGFTYKINPSTRLLFGYSYDPTPQPDEYFSARVPDADRQLFSIGASHQFSSWKLEYSYMYVDVDDRVINSSTAAGAEPNGTLAYNGKYESEVSLIGVSISKTF
ncbi:hypothetical protein MNBD_GAMMA21-1638 [hydrothermal vent metagenome]|uniref:Long-chain fatty acid transport protein n=1 Tax=hydrothermal vent metagenome TaxID=652676 RepID=A0A3B1AA36_9ZZZZ